jgi:uncharacterized protein YeaO (DUF488 family)
MTLFTRSILTPRLETDGVRVSVMSRHTYNDGITPNPEITSDLYDEWCPELAPNPELLGDYYKRGMSWNDFAEAYERLLDSSVKSRMVKKLAEIALFGNITLLCIEESPENCHRRLLAERCKSIEPRLEIEIH